MPGRFTIRKSLGGTIFVRNSIFDILKNITEQDRATGYAKLFTAKNNAIIGVSAGYGNGEVLFLETEVRDGFIVDEKRKRVWRTELDLLKAFDKLCRENNLTYFAEYGTLLGAVRHKGFIPWDDDLDVGMMREDYNKLLKLAPGYFQSPYYFQNVYNSPQFICTFSKLRDDRTSAVEHPHLDAGYHQGIFLDIFPLDDVPDGQQYTTDHFRIITDLWRICLNPSEYADSVNSGDRTPAMRPEFLNAVLQMPLSERFKLFESSVTEMNGKSKLCNDLTSIFCGAGTNRIKSWYDEIIDVPFEDTTIPIPSRYDLILEMEYGDYMKPVMGGSAHENAIIDPDKPYTYYLTGIKQQG